MLRRLPVVPPPPPPPPLLPSRLHLRPTARWMHSRSRRRRAERMARLEQELANSNERRRAARLTELDG
eukprot:scaffold5895_cov116-Isochrysis_galbana.AAC.1